MSDEEWEQAYRAAWLNYYTPEHVRTILRRAAAHRLGRPKTALTTILWFNLMILFESVHPLEGGAFRLKFRRDRRHGMPIESRFVFYPRYFGETVVKACRYLAVYRDAMRTLKQVLKAAGPLDLHRPRHCATARRRTRHARPVPRHQRRRSGSGQSAPGGCRTGEARRRCAVNAAAPGAYLESRVRPLSGKLNAVRRRRAPARPPWRPGRSRLRRFPFCRCQRA